MLSHGRVSTSHSTIWCNMLSITDSRMRWYVEHTLVYRFTTLITHYRKSHYLWRLYCRIEWLPNQSMHHCWNISMTIVWHYSAISYSYADTCLHQPRFELEFRDLPVRQPTLSSTKTTSAVIDTWNMYTTKHVIRILWTLTHTFCQEI